MRALLELQVRAREAFLFGRGGPLEADLVTRQLAPGLQIEIYENNVRENFRKALAATYEVVAQLAGADCFATLARDYQRAHPSRSGDLERFGADFAAFLDTLYDTTPFAYLADMARLERLYEDARFAADLPAADLAMLATAEESAVAACQFGLHPSVGLCRSRFPVHSIWLAHQADRVSADLGAPGEQVLIWRQAGAVRIATIDAATFSFFDALRRGCRLADALTCAGDVDAGFDAGPALQMLAVNGLIVTVKLTDFATGEH
ncbi:MAG: DUF2063 domain-containing protein [Gammaproteobacteria bacterium]|nr:DUF2063 domain-containing protein [Gammaproteobacteria bacterium]